MVYSALRGGIEPNLKPKKQTTTEAETPTPTNTIHQAVDITRVGYKYVLIMVFLVALFYQVIDDSLAFYVLLSLSILVAPYIC